MNTNKKINLNVNGKILPMTILMAEQWLESSFNQYLQTAKVCEDTHQLHIDDKNELVQLCSMLSAAISDAYIASYVEYFDAVKASGIEVTSESQSRFDFLVSVCKRKYMAFDFLSDIDPRSNEVFANAEIKMHEDVAADLRTAHEEARQSGEIIEVDFEELCSHSFIMLNESFEAQLPPPSVSLA
jgi:hypothetical protein